MELEEAIQTLKDFAKYGRYYSNNTEHYMKTAINTVLNQGDSLKFKYQARKDRLDTIITKQEKIIELMARFIDTELSSEHLSKVLKIDVKPLETYREDIKQYFEKKAEEG